MALKLEKQLLTACREGRLDEVRRLVNEQGADTSCQDDDGNTPLHLACAYGHTEIVRFLTIDKQCDAECRNNNQNTPLHYAAVGGNLDIFKLLVDDIHCDPTVKGQHGRTPLHVACEKGHLDIAKYLIDEVNVDPVCKDDTALGAVPIHLASKKGHTHIVRFLTIERQMDAECRDNHQYTPLHAAARNGHLDIVQLLINENHCNPMCRTLRERTPLHSACQEGRLDVAKYLIDEQHVDPLVQDKVGITPLYMAAKNGRTEIVKYLVGDKKCDPRPKTKRGDTPYDKARDYGHMDVALYLESQGGGPSDARPPPSSGEGPPVSPARESGEGGDKQTPSQKPVDPSKNILQKYPVSAEETLLRSEDLPLVVKTVSKLSARWNNIRTFLRVFRSNEEIKRRFPRVAQRCLTIVLDDWLKLLYEKEHDSDRPSWRHVVRFVAHSNGGQDATLAEYIAKNHQNLRDNRPGSMATDADAIQIFTKDETIGTQAMDIAKKLSKIAPKWFEIGILLGIPVSKLEELRPPSEDDAEFMRECLQFIIKEWLNTTKPEYRTWQFLAFAIEDRAGGGNSVLAKELTDYGLRDTRMTALLQAIESDDKDIIELIMMQGIFTGLPRAGKSTLMKRLVGKPVERKTVSTDVADNVLRVDIRLDQSLLGTASVQVTSSKTWHVLDDLKEETSVVAEMAYQIIQPSMFESRSDLSGQISQEATVEDESFEQDQRFEQDESLEQNESALEHGEPVLDTSQSNEPAQAQSDEPDPEHISDQHGFLKQALQTKNLAHLQEMLKGSYTLYLTDCGGQPEFQELLPALVSGPSLFFFVFKLTPDLDVKKTFQVKYVSKTESAKTKTFKYESKFSLGDFFLQSLASIASTRAHRLERKGNRWQPVMTRPKVIVVATHKDQVKADKIKDVDCQLQRLIRHTPHFEKLIYFASSVRPKRMMFTIDNFAEDAHQKGGTDTQAEPDLDSEEHVVEDFDSDDMSSEDSECSDLEDTDLESECSDQKDAASDIQKIRRAVEDIAQKPEFKVQIHLRWLLAGIMMRNKMRNEKVPVLSFHDDCCELAHEWCIDTTKVIHTTDSPTDPIEMTELDLALWFLHTQTGIIRHFGMAKELHDVVIADPRYLFNPITRLIVLGFKGSASHMVEAESHHDKLRKRGTFKSELFEEASATLLPKGLLVKLLEYLRIAVRLKHDGAYFMPCMLGYAKMGKELTQIYKPYTPLPTEEVPPLLIRFECGFCLTGVFGALTTCLLAKPKSQEEQLEWNLPQETFKFFRNQICLRISGSDMVLLQRYPKYLKIVLLSSEHSLIRECLKHICIEVRKTIDSSVKEALSTLHYTDAEYSFAFECPREAEVHVHSAKSKKDLHGRYLECHMHGTVYKIPRGCYIWYEEDPPQPQLPAQLQTSDVSQPTDHRLDIKLEPGDLPYVIRAVSMLSEKWQNIHTCLGITRTCGNISKAHSQNPMCCLITVLHEWLTYAYDMEHYGEPSWKNVVQFVKEETGGNNAPHALYIEGHIAEILTFKPGIMAKQAKAAPLRVDEGPEAVAALVQTVAQQLMEVGAKWFEIGVLLGVPVNTLRTFSQSVEADDSYQCLLKIVREWLNVSKPERRTWQVLADAVEHQAGGGNPRLAKQIAEYSNKLGQGCPEPQAPCGGGMWGDAQQVEQSMLMTTANRHPYTTLILSPKVLQEGVGIGQQQVMQQTTLMSTAAPDNATVIPSHDNQLALHRKQATAAPNTGDPTVVALSPALTLEDKTVTFANVKLEPSVSVNDCTSNTFPAKYWELENFGHPQKLNGKGTVIAILDTGINNLVQAFVGKKIPYCRNFVNDFLMDSDVTDCNGHGTHCSGIACGRPYVYQDESKTCINFPGGVAPESQIIVCRVATHSKNGFDPEVVCRALDWLIELKEDGQEIDVISMSFGSPKLNQWQQVNNRIHKLTEMGAVCVAAVGNVDSGQRSERALCYPALFESVVRIGAHDNYEQVANFTPIEVLHDYFLAPGVNICAPSHQGTGYDLVSASGTSCAASAVAGLISLLIQRARWLEFPESSTGETPRSSKATESAVASHSCEGLTPESEMKKPQSHVTEDKAPAYNVGLSGNLKTPEYESEMQILLQSRVTEDKASDYNVEVTPGNFKTAEYESTPRSSKETEYVVSLHSCESLTSEFEMNNLPQSRVTEDKTSDYNVKLIPQSGETPEHDSELTPQSPKFQFEDAAQFYCQQTTAKSDVDEASYFWKQASRKSDMNASDGPGLGGDKTTDSNGEVTRRSGKTPEYELDKALHSSKRVTQDSDMNETDGQDGEKTSDANGESTPPEYETEASRSGRISEYELDKALHSSKRMTQDSDMNETDGQDGDKTSDSNGESTPPEYETESQRSRIIPEYELDKALHSSKRMSQDSDMNETPQFEGPSEDGTSGEGTPRYGITTQSPEYELDKALHSSKRVTQDSDMNETDGQDGDKTSDSNGESTPPEYETEAQRSGKIPEYELDKALHSSKRMSQDSDMNETPQFEGPSEDGTSGEGTPRYGITTQSPEYELDKALHSSKRMTQDSDMNETDGQDGEKTSDSNGESTPPEYESEAPRSGRIPEYELDKALHSSKRMTQDSDMPQSDGQGGDDSNGESTPPYGKTPLVCETAVTLQSGKNPEYELDKVSKVVTAKPGKEAPECNEEATQGVNVKRTPQYGKTRESTTDDELAARTPQYGKTRESTIDDELAARTPQYGKTRESTTDDELAARTPQYGKTRESTTDDELAARTPQYGKTRESTTDDELAARTPQYGKTRESTTDDELAARTPQYGKTLESTTDDELAARTPQYGKTRESTTDDELAARTPQYGKTRESTTDDELAARTPQYGNEATGKGKYATIGGIPISKCVKTYRVLHKLLLHMTNYESEHEHGPLHPNKVFELDDSSFYELVQHIWYQ